MHALMTIGIVAFLAGAGVLGADGSGKAAHANQLSRADDNTNMPEFIDVGSLVAAASVQDDEHNLPRPTAKIEDVGGAAAQGAKKQIQPPANPVGNRAVVVKEGNPQNKDSGTMHDKSAEHNGAPMARNGMNIHPAHHQQPLESSVSVASEVPMTRTVVENKFVTKTVIDRDAIDENDNKASRKTGSANARGGSSSIVSARKPNQLDKSGSDDEESAAMSLQRSTVFGTIFFGLIGYFTA